MIINDKAHTQSFGKRFSLFVLRESTQRHIRKSTAKYCIRSSYDGKFPNLMNDAFSKFRKYTTASNPPRVVFSAGCYCNSYYNVTTMKDVVNRYYECKALKPSCKIMAFSKNKFKQKSIALRSLHNRKFSFS